MSTVIKFILTACIQSHILEFLKTFETFLEHKKKNYKNYIYMHFFI